MALWKRRALWKSTEEWRRGRARADPRAGSLPLSVSTPPPAPQGTGIKYWGGGVFCSQNMMSRPMEGAANGNRFIMGPQSCMADNGGERGSANAGEVRRDFPQPPSSLPPAYSKLRRSFHRHAQRL